MPINLRYGQQAVARGFLDPQRLQTVLAKQRALADQGKKVSVRMILEKAKLLTPDQMAQIDRDLNIKVVKKHTSKVERPGAPRPAGPTSAQNFMGEAPPQFAGMGGDNPDATVFSPPPPDMQDRIRAERDKSKADARRKQEQQAAQFFQQNQPQQRPQQRPPQGQQPAFADAGFGDDASPFGGDPFGGGDMAPEPFGGEMQPEPFGGEMQPEPFGEMQPEPFAGDLQPQDNFGGGFAQDDGGFGGDPFGAQEPELSRMDSSPKLESLAAEYDGFAAPEDEALPTISAFDEPPQHAAPPARGGFNQPRQPQYQPPQYQAPMQDDLAPASADFDSFGNDIRSPEELEMGAVGGASGTKPLGGGDIDATMFSPPPPGLGTPRQKTGAMDKTMFSPPPPGFRPSDRAAPMPEPEPDAGDWGEADAQAGFDDAFGAEPEPAEANMDATVFSPPPPEQAAKNKTSARKGADDFGNVDLPKGKRFDDVPTAPASLEEDIHPLRRGVGTSSASVKKTTSPQPVPPADDLMDELPGDEQGGFDASADVPDASPPDADIPDETPDEPKKGKSGKGVMPTKAPKNVEKGKTGKTDKKKKELPKAQVEVADGGEGKKKSAGKRVLLIFTILLLLFVAVLTLPVALSEQSWAEPIRPLRNHPQAKPIYDYVDYEIMNRIREWTGQPIKARPGPAPQVIPFKPAENIPGDTGGEAPADTGGETPADTGGETGGTGG